MSHFVGLVFGSNVETLLEPYDEHGGRTICQIYKG